MDEAMGRRTVGGLLLTKGGSILVFREDSPRRKATACCTRLGCSTKIFRDKDKKLRRATKEAVTPQRSQLVGRSNRIPHQGRMAYDNSTNRNPSSTSSEAANRPIRETAGRDLLARLKERVNASKKRSLSGWNNPPSPNTSTTGSSGSSRSVSRSLYRPASRAGKDGCRNGDAFRMHRDSSGSSREDVLRSDDYQGRFLSRSMFRHRSRLQGGPLSYSEDSLDDSNEHGLDESEEVEDYYVFNDRHRGMRMDIEDMSYEELLALGERIGTVSTGLSDDALSECLRKILYVPSISTTHEDGDIKCIICQEEYLSAEEVAKMACKHYFHIICIEQWLQQKNWCPICKSVASATKPSCT